jgi:replicative DNA helicase
MDIDYKAIRPKADLRRLLHHYGAVVVRRGRFLQTNCIFHKDRDPSFTIYEDGHFYCFGCQATGDAVDIVQKLEGLDKQAAVKRVTEIYGLLEQEITKPTINGHSVNGNGNGKTRRVPKGTVQPIKALAEKPSAWAQKAGIASKDGNAEPKIEYGPWELFAVYDRYVNADGLPRYEVHRFHRYSTTPGANKKYDKKFQQRWKHEDGSWVWGITAGLYLKEGGDWVQFKADRHSARESEAVEMPAIERVLYDLPAVLSSNPVFLVEGEKKADEIRILGLVATTASGGSNAEWLPSFTEAVRGKTVYHVPDNDEPGQRFANKIEATLKTACDYLRITLPQQYNDICDYFVDKFSDGNPDQRRQALYALTYWAQEEARRKELEERGLISIIEAVSLFPGGERAYLNCERQKGINTGFDRFDRMTLGLHAQELLILAARPAMGKTGLATNIATHVASEEGKAVAVFSLEMSRISLIDRIICSESRIDLQRLRSGCLTQDEKDRMNREYKRTSKIPLFIDDTAGTNLESVHSKLHRLQKEQNLGLVVIDYLQLMQGHGRFENRVQEISSLSRGLKLMSKDLKVPFMVLSQLSRAPETRGGDHRPMLNDLKESGQIEQDADVVAFIFREEVYRPDKEGVKGIAEIILAKQRNGPTGRIKLAYISKYVRFENLAEDRYRNDPEQFNTAYD